MQTPLPFARTHGGHSKKGHVMLVEDNAYLRTALERTLRNAGYEVTVIDDGAVALERIKSQRPDVLLSDLDLPGLDGVSLLRHVREIDLDVPVLLMTGSPSLDTAIQALELGALKYFVKPCGPEEILRATEYAVNMHRMTRLKREVLIHMGFDGAVAGDRAGLEATFERALQTLWMAWQPIVSWSENRVFAYEGLVRTKEMALANPTLLIGAAERLGALSRLAAAIHSKVGEALRAVPTDRTLFVNLHPRDLVDTTLFGPDSPLSDHAGRLVLELTERAALDQSHEAMDRVASLRRRGFRIAVDDLGAGFAGLTSVARLEPEVVKIDMSLVRDIDKHPRRLELLGGVVRSLDGLGMLVVCEGIETDAERAAVTSVGVDLLQGYLIGRPGPELVSWSRTSN